MTADPLSGASREALPTPPTEAHRERAAKLAWDWAHGVNTTIAVPLRSREVEELADEIAAALANADAEAVAREQGALDAILAAHDDWHAACANLEGGCSEHGVAWQCGDALTETVESWRAKLGLRRRAGSTPPPAPSPDSGGA